MSAWKFVVLEINHGAMAVEVPVLFPAILTHSVVAEAIKMQCIRGGRRNVKVVSAGAIGGVEVRGLGDRSESLGIEARGPQDTRLINSYHLTRGTMLK